MLVEFADSWLTASYWGSFHFCIYVESHLMQNNIIGKSFMVSRVFHLSANLCSWCLVCHLKNCVEETLVGHLNRSSLQDSTSQLTRITRHWRSDGLIPNGSMLFPFTFQLSSLCRHRRRVKITIAYSNLWWWPANVPPAKEQNFEKGTSILRCLHTPHGLCGIIWIWR